MDTSKEYILMCEKAEEIQELWNCEKKDFTIEGYKLMLRSAVHMKLWLPRQDQLQEMINPESYFDRPGALLLSFYNFVDMFNASGNAEYHLQFTSMEQLWLAFVMSEKYGKQWDEKNWVNK